MIILDSNVLIGFFNEEDSLHEQCIEKMRRLEAEHNFFILNNYILNECINVMKRKTTLEKTKEMINVILNHNKIKLLHLGEEDFFKAIETFNKQKYTLSFVDATLINTALERNLKIATFDKALEKEYLEKKK